MQAPWQAFWVGEMEAKASGLLSFLMSHKGSSSESQSWRQGLLDSPVRLDRWEHRRQWLLVPCRGRDLEERRILRGDRGINPSPGDMILLFCFHI